MMFNSKKALYNINMCTYMTIMNYDYYNSAISGSPQQKRIHIYDLPLKNLTFFSYCHTFKYVFLRLNKIIEQVLTAVV